jgi:hypothetical protein
MLIGICGGKYIYTMQGVIEQIADHTRPLCRQVIPTTIPHRSPRLPTSPTLPTSPDTTCKHRKATNPPIISHANIRQRQRPPRLRHPTLAIPLRHNLHPHLSHSRHPLPASLLPPNPHRQSHQHALAALPKPVPSSFPLRALARRLCPPQRRAAVLARLRSRVAPLQSTDKYPQRRSLAGSFSRESRCPESD